MMKLGCRRRFVADQSSWMKRCSIIGVDPVVVEPQGWVVAPDELASHCLHALAAAGSLPSKSAVRRLVTVTLAGLRPSN
jgi:hypothetical protein